MAQSDLQTRSTLAAYFSTHVAAERAVNQLQQAGFASGHVGYAGRASDSYSPDESAYDDSGAGAKTGSTSRNAANRAGEKTGGAWAKIKNFFEGGDVEPYADRKERGELASGEITQPNADYTASVANTSLENRGYENTGYDGVDSTDLHGSLAGLSIPEEHSRYLSRRLGRAEEGAVVTVNAEGREAEARSILMENGGDLEPGAGSYDDDEASTTGGAPAQRIQLLGEVLRVHKDRINRGEVRLRKEVTTEQQTVQVPLTREEFVLERIAGDGSVPIAGAVGTDGEIRIPLSEEVASIEKQTVVREQVAVGKRTVQDVRNLDANVGHEELRVEDSTTGDNRR